MVARKQFQTTKELSPRLRELLDSSRARLVTEDELHEQRISFAYGNAPVASKNITKETVRRAGRPLTYGQRLQVRGPI